MEQAERERVIGEDRRWTGGGGREQREGEGGCDVKGGERGREGGKEERLLALFIHFFCSDSSVSDIWRRGRRVWPVQRYDQSNYGNLTTIFILCITLSSLSHLHSLPLPFPRPLTQDSSPPQGAVVALALTSPHNHRHTHLTGCPAHPLAHVLGSNSSHTTFHD